MREAGRLLDETVVDNPQILKAAAAVRASPPREVRYSSALAEEPFEQMCGALKCLGVAAGTGEGKVHVLLPSTREKRRAMPCCLGVGEEWPVLRKRAR
ncbi:MAG: hypothetical protein IPP07_29955 [Holophagales bacterium]|nr:hypothetical protein [Holophagales bacterium]